MSLTQGQREAIIKEAQSWAGTPYRGWSALKGAGVDCGQLIYAVYRALGLVPEVELPKDYSLQVAQHRASTEYVDFILRFCEEIPEADVLPGDIVVYRLGHAFAHGGIVVKWPEFVMQAEAHHGACGAHGTRTAWVRRAPRKFYSLRAEFTAGGL